MEPPLTPRRHGRWPLLAALASGAVGLALAAYALSLPGSLLGVHEYDDGVYFGAAIRLTQGSLPYRDFVLLHPPAIVLLTAPLALIGHIVGSDGGLAAARVLTAMAAGTSCALAALVVRHRGAAASLLAGLGLACFPYAVAADQTLMLEPYLVTGCLAGAVLAFEGGSFAGGRRAVAAGALFGLATAVKIWGAIPFLALLACAALLRRRSVLPLAAGALAGFGVPSLPFFAADPVAFVRDIVVDQLARTPGGQGDVGLVRRIGELTGLSAFPALHAGRTVEVAVAIAVVSFVALSLAATGRPSPCEWFLAAAFALSLSAVLWSHEFYPHYAYFPVALLTPLVGASVLRWRPVLARLLVRRAAGGSAAYPIAAPGPALTVQPAPPGAARSEPGSPAPAWARPVWPQRGAVLAGLLLAAGLFFAVRGDAGVVHSYVESEHPFDVAAVIDSVVPPGACVVSDESIVLIAADRFASPPPGCPAALVDSFGTWLSVDPAATPPAPGSDVPSLAAQWSRWLHRAGYVVQSVPTSDYIAWTPALLQWFGTHFRLAASATHAYVYVRVRHPARP